MPTGNDVHPSQRHPPEGSSQFQRRSVEQDAALVPVMKEERDEVSRDGDQGRENANNQEIAPKDGPVLGHPVQARSEELKELGLTDRERGLSNIRRPMGPTDSGQVVKQTSFSTGTPTWLTDAVLRMQARQASEAAAAAAAAAAEAQAAAAAVEADILNKKKNCTCPADSQSCLCGALNENSGAEVLGLTSSQVHRRFGYGAHWLSMPTAGSQSASSGHRQDHDNTHNRNGQYDSTEEAYGHGQASRQAQEADEHAEADNSSEHNDADDHEANWLLARRKADIVSHPLFPELLSAHVACLRIATPVDQLPTIDAQLSQSHLVISKYQAINIDAPDDNSDKDELEQYMTDSVMLLRSFRDQLQQHVRVHAMEAVMACFEIEKQLEDLTGVRLGESGKGSGAMMSDDEDDILGDDAAYAYDPALLDGNESGGFGPLIPSETERTLMERVRQELKSELKQELNALSVPFLDETSYAGGGGSSDPVLEWEMSVHGVDRHEFLASRTSLREHTSTVPHMPTWGYRAKIIDVREEILRKRRAGKLPGDTTTVLKTWWHAHAKWPYPTEDEKARLVQETGLELKQINNWFINQRKRNWHANPSAAAAKTKRKR